MMGRAAFLPRDDTSMSQLPTDLDAASPFFDRSDLAVSFADPARPDSPLTYVNPAFCRLVGYERDECVGRNCRFLQGAGTDPAAVASIRRGIDERSFAITPIVNYRKGGERFRNGLLVGPVRDVGGELQLLFGMQWDVDRTLELRRRRGDAGADVGGWAADDLGSQLDRFAAIVQRVSSASERRGGEDLSVSLVERLVAVSRPQRYPPHERLPNWTRAESLLNYLFEPYEALTDYPYPPPRLEGDADIVAVDVAHALALAVHELSHATGCLARAGLAPEVSMSCGTAALDGEPVIELSWRTRTVEVGDPDVDPLPARTRSGLRVVADVVEAIGGRFEHELGERAIEARVRLPNRTFESLGLE